LKKNSILFGVKEKSTTFVPAIEQDRTGA